MLVTPNATKDDIIFLAALERVNTGNLDLFVKVFLQGAIELHVVDDIRALALVRCDDADLSWNDARFEELRDDFLDIRGFRPE